MPIERQAPLQRISTPFRDLNPSRPCTSGTTTCSPWGTRPDRPIHPGCVRAARTVRNHR